MFLLEMMMIILVLYDKNLYFEMDFKWTKDRFSYPSHPPPRGIALCT